MGHTAKRDTKGFTLIELLIVIIIIGILAAIAIPMFLGQRDKAKESAVKGGVHNIELGVASYGVDHGDLYPPDGGVDATTMASYVDNWPKNPWTGDDMADSANEGDFEYIPGSGLASFQIVGHGRDGTPVMTAP
jgi:type II secretion system protein G